ncbi:unnamed protein product [Blepharisma stoltei]|uniref:Beach domain-containing protein n=1 Tax=Blepharisma stoltei TaxID=1481888 RepID=A0AAU9IVF9_9CILI|nr:unnamed protein product [Blepharisma stoltei]
MAIRNKSFQGPLQRVLKLSDLSESSAAWHTFCSAQNQNLMSFLPVARVCDRELSVNEFTEFQANKQFVSVLVSSITESMVLHLARLQAFKDSQDEHSEPQSILNEMSEQLFPFLRILQSLMLRNDGSTKINIEMIEQLISFYDLLKSVTNSINEDPNQLILKYYCLFSDTIWLLIYRRKRQNDQEVKLLNLAYQNLEGLLLELITKENLKFLATEPISTQQNNIKLALKFNERSSEVDLALYLILALCQICKLPQPVGVQLTLSDTIPKAMTFILSIEDFRTFQHTSKTRLALEKSVLILELLNSVCYLTSKLEHQGKQFLKGNQDKLKGIFYYSIQNYVKYYMTVEVLDYEHDNGYLGQFYRNLYTLISTNALSSDLEGIPIMLFSLLVQGDLVKELDTRTPQVQAFTLQFLEKFLQLIGKKKTDNKFSHMKEFGLIGTLFSKPLFDVDEIYENDKEGFGSECLGSWNRIWAFLTENPKNIDWICNAIVRHIKLSQTDYKYLLKINLWMREQFDTNQEIGEGFIRNGIVEEIIHVIIQLKKSNEHDDQLITFFIMVKSMLEMYDISQLTKVNGIMDPLLQDMLLYDPVTSDLCLSCISRILRYQDSASCASFQSLLTRIDDIDMSIKLLNSMQESLREVSTKRGCQENFVKGGVLKTLKNKLTKPYSDTPTDKIILLWASVLECVRFLIEDNPVCKKQIHEFDFSAIANTIRSDSFQTLRALIYTKSIESLLYILYENNNLRTEELLNVKTPEVIPLVIELLADSGSNDFCSYINHSLVDSINAAHFANRRTTDILLNVLKRQYSEQLFNFIEDVLSKVMSHHITPQELQKIIDIARASCHMPEKQLLLYRCLSRAIENSFVPIDHIKFENHVGLSPTRYFCFRYPKCFLKCTTDEDFSFLPPKKEFSIFAWIYPEKLDSYSSCFLEFSDGKSSYFSVSLTDQKMTVEYIDGKSVFKVTSSGQLLEREWNLIGVSLKGASRYIPTPFMGVKFDVDLCINGEVNNKKSIEGSICCLKENFTQMMCGNNAELESPFIGRITSLYITSRSLLDYHYSQIYGLSFQYNLNYYPEEVSTSESFVVNKIVLKEIYNSFVFQWHPRNRLPVCSASRVMVQDECERFNGVTVLEAISANGGLKILMPLIKEWWDSEKNDRGVVLILNMIGDICQAQSLESIITKEFFDLLGLVLEESITEITESLLESIKKIVGKLGWNPERQFQALKSLLLNKKLWTKLTSDLQENYLGTLSLYIPYHFQCTPEKYSLVYTHLGSIKNTSLEFVLEILEKLLPKEIECSHVEAITAVIFRMMDENQVLLGMFLEMLNRRAKMKKNCILDVCTVMLYLLEKNKSPEIQAHTLRILNTILNEIPLMSPLERKSAVISARDEFEMIDLLFYAIDKRLDGVIHKETYKIIVEIAQNFTNFADQRIGDKFGMFADLVTKRLSESPEADFILRDINLLVEKDAKYSTLLFNRENFPMWIYSFYSKESYAEAENLSLSLLSDLRHMKNFNKLRALMIGISTENRHDGFNKALDFYLKLLLKINAAHSFNENIELFLDFSSVLEDLIHPDYIGVAELNINLYCTVIHNLLEISKDLRLVFCTFPYIPPISFESLNALLKEMPGDRSIPDSTLFMREGGFLRLILKFIFIGLGISQEKMLIDDLKYILKGGNMSSPYLIFNMPQKQEWEKRFNERAVELHTSIYANFPPRMGDLLYSQDFLAAYVLAECTEILVFSSDQPLLKFLREFIKESEVYISLNKLVSNLTQKEIDELYSLMKEYKFNFCSTSRSRFHQLEKNKFIHHLNVHLQQDFCPLFNNFQLEIKEQSDNLKRLKDQASSLKTLLCSTDWISNVHFFILAATSMKLNFISSTVRLPDYYKPKSSWMDQNRGSLGANDSLTVNLNQHISAKEESINELHNNYEQNQDRAKLLLNKRYWQFLKQHEKLKIILAGQIHEHYKLRQVFDRIGRMPFIETTNKARSSSRNISCAPSTAEIGRLSHIAKVDIEVNDNSEDPAETDLTMTSTGEADESSQNPFDESPSSATVFTELKQTVRFECEWISVTQSVFGFIEISQNYLIYVSEGKEKPETRAYFGSALKFTQRTCETKKIWETQDMAEVLPRRFIHQHTAIEVYLRNGKSMMFNLFDTAKRDEALNSMKSWEKGGVKVIKEISQKLILSYAKQWQSGKLSNMEYLLILNKLSSRSFNDISQYPIFPWVIKEFNIDVLNLDEPGVYRDLSYPIGALNPESKAEAIRKFTMWKDEEIQPFHYGSHYSSAGIVLHYLVRLDPFTEQAQSLQGGHFDVPDRLFYSVEAAWESGQGTSGDVKEMVPELFYLPEIFLNLNKENFGVRQDHIKVDDVELPKWAKSPSDFVRKHRLALESWYVNQNLHNWIDLIFGYKQHGKPAENFYNTFCSITYEDMFRRLLAANAEEDYESLQGYVEQVVHFGQTPVQLFKVPHPVRDKVSKSLTIFEKCRNEAGFENMDYRCYEVEGVIYALIPTAKNLIGVKGLGNKLILMKMTIRKDLEELKVDFSSYREYDLEGVTNLVLEDWEEGVQWKYSYSSDSNSTLKHNPYQFCIWEEDKLVSGFHIDNSFKVHKLNGNLLMSICHHAGLVTCVAAASFLFSGSMDTSIVSWSNFLSDSTKAKPYNLYLGHTEAIKQLSVSGNYQVLVSLSNDGTVLLHDIRSAECLKKLFGKSENPCKFISISEMGLVACSIYPDVIRIFSINGSEFRDIYIDQDEIHNVHDMQFNKTGENLLIGTNNAVGFYDIFEENIKAFKRVCENIITVVYPTGQEFLIFAINKDTTSVIYTLETSAKDARRLMIRSGAGINN